jgi:hypothetical protein
MGAQNRKIILFVDNCAANPKDTPFLRNVRVVWYLANSTSALQPLDLGIIHVSKHTIENALCKNPFALWSREMNKEKKLTYSKQCTK